MERHMCLTRCLTAICHPDHWNVGFVKTTRAQTALRRIKGEQVRFDALNRLWESVRASSHDFDISTQVFPNLDVDRVANDLGLATKGTDRGSADEPPSDSAGLDEIELAVVERVEEEKKA
ncbi:MAG: hypothetical protein E5Y89_12775, partial [Mesorhizobium sp.]